MNSSHIFWPVLAQVFLTLMMFILLGVRKAKAVKAKEVDRKQAALDVSAWPDYVVQVNNNIDNQFAAPVLFYVLCFVLHSVNAVGTVAIGLAWLFVASRSAHAYIHIGSNYVPMRMRMFLVGALTLLVMLGLVVWKLAVGS
jgi:hypothetical protein